MPQPPEMPPLQIAAVRAALCKALAEQAQVAYQALLADQPDDQVRPSIDVPPERIAAAARLLSESSALNAAVSLLSLEVNNITTHSRTCAGANGFADRFPIQALRVERRVLMR